MEGHIYYPMEKASCLIGTPWKEIGGVRESLTPNMKKTGQDGMRAAIQASRGRRRGKEGGTRGFITALCLQDKTLLMLLKLDGVGPVDNRPSTD